MNNNIGRLARAFSYHAVISSIIFFTVFSINIRGITSKGSEVQNYILKLSQPPHVICIQETLLNNDNEFHFQDYALINRNRLYNKGGGCAIYIHKTVTYRILTISDSHEYIKVHVEYESFQTTIVNYYNPCHTIMPSVLKEFLQDSHKNVLIVGDFNSHNSIWGSNKVDNNGKLIEEFLNQNDLVLLNDGSPTRYDMRFNSYSHIDLSISSSNIANKIKWQVLPENFDSDHFLLQIDISINDLLLDPSFTSHNLSRSYNRADWDLYFNLTEGIIEEEIKDDNVDVYYNNLIQYINRCANYTIPPYKPHPTHNPTPWWSKDCAKAIKARNRAKRKYQRTADLIDLVEYKKLKAIAQRTVRRARFTHWKKFCASLNHNTPTSKVWNKIKSTSCSELNINKTYPIKDQTGRFVDDPSLKSNIIANYFSQKLFIEDLNDTYPTIEKEDTHNQFLNDKLSIKELYTAINTASNSAQGPDNIKLILIKKAHNNFVKVILNFLNFVWETGNLPTSWHHAIVIPIPKPQKDKSMPNGYRPISLTCTFCKIMERIINSRLVWFLEKYNILCAEQSGFRPGRSVTDNTLKLQNDVIKAFVKKQFVCAVFMDLEGAFDAVRHSKLISILQATGIKGRMLRWICDFLRDRTFRVRMEGAVSDLKVTNRGLPQGSVISPTLFNIFIHNIQDSCSHSNLSIYADDLALWKAGANVSYIQEKVQFDINNLLAWSLKHDINISKEKTKFLIFSQKKKIHNIKLYLDKHDIERVNTFKFLGVYFESTLSWKTHIENLASRCFLRINMLRAITGSSCGANCRTLLVFYKQYIRPILEYGSELFNNSSKVYTKKLDIVQYLALRIITGAIKTTSLHALQTLCNERPLDINRNLIDEKYKIRLSIYNNPHLTKDCISNCWEFGVNSMICKQEPFYNRTLGVGQDCQVNKPSPIPPWYIPELEIDLTLHDDYTKKDSPHLLKCISLDRINTTYSNSLSIYTDGSKDPDTGITGASMCVPYFNVQSFSRLSPVSVCRAEQVAILMALNWIAQYKPLRVAIFSDSFSTLQLLQGNFFKASGIILEILLLHRDLLFGGTQIAFCWIPSHCDIAGNEVADLLAKKALKNSIIDICIAPDASEKRCERIKLHDQIWQMRWDRSNHGRFLYNSIRDVTKKRTFMDLPRKSEIIYNRLILGKAINNEILFTFNASLTNKCATCNQVDNVYHYLFECSKYINARKEFAEKLAPDTFMYTNIFDSSNTHLLLDFVKNTNMLNHM